MTSTIIALIALLVTIVGLYVQNNRNKRQQFEHSFFNLLQAIRELVNNTKGAITFTDETQEIWEGMEIENLEGLEYYRSANRELRERVAVAMDEVNNEQFNALADNQRAELVRTAVIKGYDDFFDDHISHLAHYFRFVYNVVVFVDSAEILNLDEKQRYMKFVQAQMLSEEISLMFYNGLGKYGKKFRPLLDDYQLLQNVNPGDTDDIVYILKSFYPNTKFRFVLHANSPDWNYIVDQLQLKAKVKQPR